MSNEQQAYPTGSHLKVERNSRGVTWSVSVQDPDDDKGFERTALLTEQMERKYGKLVTEVPDA